MGNKVEIVLPFVTFVDTEGYNIINLNEITQISEDFPYGRVYFKNGKSAAIDNDEIVAISKALSQLSE